MQLTLHIPSTNYYWDARHGIFDQRSATKYRCFSERICVFNYFRQKLAAEKVSSTKKFNCEVVSQAKQ